MVLFWYGENSFAIRQQVKQLVERFKAKNSQGFGLERFDAEAIGALGNEGINRVLGAITNLPLFGGHSLVIVEDILSHKALAEAVMNQLDRVPSSTVLVLVQIKADERTKVFKTLLTKAKAQKFVNLSGPQLLNWVVKTASQLGGAIDKPTASLLIAKAGQNQWLLYNELVKLINYQPQISSANIEAMVEASFQDTIFDLIEAVSASQLDRALDLYRGLRANKAQPLYVLSMLGWQLKNLIVAKLAAELSIPPTQVAKDFKISPFVLQKAAAVARRVDINQLKSVNSLILTTDYKLKTSGGDPDWLMEQLVSDLAVKLS